jgi:hypothetical protein
MNPRGVRHALAWFVFLLAGTRPLSAQNVWQPLGPSDLQITKILVDSKDPRTMYGLGLFPTSPNTNAPAIWKSVDGGAGWQALLGPFSFYGSPPVSLILDPLSPATLFASFTGPSGGQGGISRSVDGAASWTALTNTSTPLLYASSRPPRALYASVETFNTRALEKSLDGGDTWQSAGLSVCALAIAPSDSSILYKCSGLPIVEPPGLYSSTDAGTSWTFVNPDAKFEGGNPILVVDPQTTTTLYAGTSAGHVFKSVDGGHTWLPSSAGLTGTNVNDLVIDPSSPSTLYAATNTGLYRSTDGGGSWTNAGPAVPSPAVISLALDPLAPTTVYAVVGSRQLYRGSFAEASPCAGSATALCLGGNRFRVEVSWQSGAGVAQATALPLTQNTGAFWFFDSTNLELVVKVLDGRSVNGFFWAFYGALSNVEYTVTVTDTATGAVRTYFNPQGQLASVADTTAF